jgi:pimeloyl-ACP methyl ester carboxylesterase
LNVNVLAYDYDGYGLSDKTPSESSCYDNMWSVIEYLKTKNIMTKDIVLYGRSLGTGPSVEFASRHTFKGLVLGTYFLRKSRSKTAYRPHVATFNSVAQRGTIGFSVTD